MGSDIWSSTSSDEEKWQPNFLRNAPAPAPIGNAEDIQILLLGPPGCGKTSLQLRYTLRQFSRVLPSGANLMGGHRHVPMPGGSEVHLIIHEFPTGSGHQTSSMMDPYSPDDISRQDTLTSTTSTHQAEVHRRKLLEQSDAVMLLFNPWSKESFEWVNGSVVESIINTGRKKKLTNDIVDLLDGLTAMIPEMPRSKSTRSIKSFQKMLPRMPSSPAGSGGDASLFNGLDEKKQRDYDQVDYQGELKRISIVVEGSALKRAEFMIHERDHPPPPEPSPTPKPLVISGPMSLSDKKLPTIREVDSYASLRRGAAAAPDHHRGVPGNRGRRDSAFSFRTTSSAYSQASSTVVEDRRDSNPFTLEDLVDAHSDPPPPERPPKVVVEEEEEEEEKQEQYQHQQRRRATLLPPLPKEDLEIPVLIVASMMDRLKDGGGDLPRMVSAQQGQELARKFGPNCAYIEVSAKSNANVDEAYGILVDQVMTKRAARQKGDVVRTSKKAEDEIVIVEEEDLMDRDENDRSLPARVVRMNRPRTNKSRSCMPAWWDTFMGSVFSWGPKDSEVSAITFEDIGVGPSQVEETKEDVWGETVVVKPKKASLGALRKSGVHDSRQSSSTTSTALDDSLKRDSIIKVTQLEKSTELMGTNPFMPEEPRRSAKLITAAPVTSPVEDLKKYRPDEALLDKLDRKLSKKKPRPDSKGTPSDSSDEEDHKLRHNEAILDKVSRKIGLDAGPTMLNEKPQPPLPISKDTRPLSVDSSLSRSFIGGKSMLRSQAHRKHNNNPIVFLTNYAPSHTNPLNSSRSNKKTLPFFLQDDTSSSIITTATSTIPQRRRQHTSLISELPPSIPPLRFDTIRLDDRRFTVMIRLAEQELEQQRQRVVKLVRDDAAAAAPVTRSSSLGPHSAGAAVRRARGVGTNVVGAAKKRVSAALGVGAAGGLYPAAEHPPPRGRRVSAVAAAGAGAVEQKQRQEKQQQQQAAAVRTDQEARARALNKRRMVSKGHALSTPPPPPRRAATVRAVLPPTPASRPRTRPSSEARPHGRPVPVWI
ncbi:positive regulation of protein sumoylation [Diaporthe australafricana]|uniref:Positive regulation of protein sumoylation n=1 Tax=Diaporthe australafricana TaxID=127596 RepID=A0ABR3X7A3_9PEZI